MVVLAHEFKALREQEAETASDSRWEGFLDGHETIKPGSWPGWPLARVVVPRDRTVRRDGRCEPRISLVTTHRQGPTNGSSPESIESALSQGFGSER